MLYSEALASLKGPKVVQNIKIPEGGLTDMREMMVKIFATYRCKCNKDVVDEMLEHPKVRRLVG